MYRNKKKSNLLDMLYQRELDVGPSAYKLGLKIVSQLAVSEDTEYLKVHEMSSGHAIDYKCGRIFLDHHELCFTPNGSGCKLLYRLDRAESHGKVRDVEMFSGPVYNNNSCRCDLNCTCTNGIIISVSEDHWLHLHSIYNGKLLREVYTFYCPEDNDPSDFRNCNWNTYGEDIALISDIYPRMDPVVYPNLVATVAVFKTRPFEFHALFEIERCIFGENCNHVNLSDNLLILGMRSFTDEREVQIYSFLDILEEAFLYDVRIGDTCESLNNGKVGCHPTGLPLNCRITSRPPLLLSVKCWEQMIQFGGHPWHYLVIPWHTNRYVFHVKSVEDHELATNGKLKNHNVFTFFETEALFHPDNSGRIIFRTADAVYFYELKLSSSRKTELQRFASMSFQILIPQIEKVPFYARTHVIRKHYCAERCTTDSRVKSVLGSCYDARLNLFAIMGYDPDESESIGAVKLFDNTTGAELKHMSLGMSVCELNDYSLFLDLDVMIVLERKRRNHTHICHIYQLRTN